MALVLFGIRLSSNVEWSSWTHCCLPVVFTQQHHLVERTGLNKTPPKTERCVETQLIATFTSILAIVLLLLLLFFQTADQRKRTITLAFVHMKICDKVPHSRDSFEELTKRQWTVTKVQSQKWVLQRTSRHSFEEPSHTVCRPLSLPRQWLPTPQTTPALARLISSPTAHPLQSAPVYINQRRTHSLPDCAL